MPPTVWVDQNGGNAGTELDAANLNADTAADTTEAATDDVLGAGSTYVNNLNRIRYQLAQIVAGTWNAAVAMIPRSWIGAVSGVCDLDNAAHVPLSRLSGITASELSATAGITGGQIASATITGGNVAAGTIEAGNLAVNAPSSTEVGGLTASNLSPTAGITPGQLAAINVKDGALGLDANGHLTGGYAGGTAPTPTAGAAAGTGPALSLLAGSTDTYGTIDVTIGTAPPNSGTLLTVTFGTAYASAPRVVLITASDGTNAVQFFFTVYKTATDFSMYIPSGGPAAGQNYHFDYLVIA